MLITEEIDEEVIKKEYNQRINDFEKLGNIILKELISIKESYEELNIDYIQFRVKKFNSFYEKIGRNKLTWMGKDPFLENEDFCALRIIHLLNEDLDSILDLLREKFNIIREENPTEVRPKTPKEFTYRSYHVFAKLGNGIKKTSDGSLVKTNGTIDLLSQNKSLENLYAEIQIRSICMHSWAAIEHKLNYKQQDKFPKDYRPIINRKFAQMSAVLEIADEFFVLLSIEKRKIITGYKRELANLATKDNILDNTLNIDSLQAYLDETFQQGFQKEPDRVRYLMMEMLETNLKLRNIENGIKLLKEKNIYSRLSSEYPTQIPTQSGIARLILDITDKDFYNLRKDKLGKSKWMEFVDKIKRQVNK